MRKLVFLLLFALAVPGQARSFEQPELDALLAPVALYPDELVGHILVAAAYPEQVSDAARGTPVQPHWHPSVSALIAYPELLQRMAESPQWMQDLSQAYIHQQASVMLTVQSLRTRAAAHGHVPPPPAREVVYVRYYDPLVVYGPWWHVHRPVFWHPWHHHRVFVPHRHHVAPRHPIAPPRHFHPPVSKPVHTKPSHHLRVPEAQRRPILSSTPQLHNRHQKQRSFAGSQERASPSIQPRSFSHSSQHAKPR